MNSRTTRKSGPVLCCFILLSAAPGVWASQITATGQNAAILGKGYDTKAQEWRGDCLKYSPQHIVRVGAQQSTVTFTRSLTAAELSNSLGFSAGTRFRYGVTESSAAADFAREAASSQYSETTTYAATYHFKNAYLNSDELSEYAKKRIGSGPFVSDQFVETCGDEFVEQVILGAKLLINARIDFASSSDKERFAAEVSIQGPAFSLRAKLQQASARLSRSASVTISAFQLGGRVDRLSTIFSRGRAEGRGDGTAHALLTCSMDNIDSCLEVLTAALDYATSPDAPDAFPQQLANQYDPNTGQGAADLTYITRSWSSKGLSVKPRILNAAIAGHRTSLDGAMDEQLKWKSRLDSLRYEVLRLSPEQGATFRVYQAAVDLNVQDIYRAAIVCYTDDLLCPDSAANAARNVAKRQTDIQFDPTRLSITPQTFAQWCDYTGFQASVPRPALAATRRTVDALVKLARDNTTGGSVDEVWVKVGDQCQFAQDILQQLTTVGIAHAGLTDLRPITSLETIESLILRDNAIDDDGMKVGGLGRLKRLLRLDLSGNGIENSTHFVNLKSLVSLDLTGNHLSSVTDLATLTNLRVLALGGNPILEPRRCPLKNQSWCTF